MKYLDIYEFEKASDSEQYELLRKASDKAKQTDVEAATILTKLRNTLESYHASHRLCERFRRDINILEEKRTSLEVKLFLSAMLNFALMIILIKLIT